MARLRKIACFAGPPSHLAAYSGACSTWGRLPSISDSAVRRYEVLAGMQSSGRSSLPLVSSVSGKPPRLAGKNSNFAQRSSSGRIRRTCGIETDPTRVRRRRRVTVAVEVLPGAPDRDHNRRGNAPASAPSRGLFGRRACRPRTGLRSGDAPRCRSARPSWRAVRKDPHRRRWTAVRFWNRLRPTIIGGSNSLTRHDNSALDSVQIAFMPSTKRSRASCGGLLRGAMIGHRPHSAVATPNRKLGAARRSVTNDLLGLSGSVALEHHANPVPQQQRLGHSTAACRSDTTNGSITSSIFFGRAPPLGRVTARSTEVGSVRGPSDRSRDPPAPAQVLRRHRVVGENIAPPIRNRSLLPPRGVASRTWYSAMDFVSESFGRGDRPDIFLGHRSPPRASPALVAERVWARIASSSQPSGTQMELRHASVDVFGDNGARGSCRVAGPRPRAWRRVRYFCCGRSSIALTTAGALGPLPSGTLIPLRMVFVDQSSASGLRALNRGHGYRPSSRRFRPPDCQPVPMRSSVRIAASV